MGEEPIATVSPLPATTDTLLLVADDLMFPSRIKEAMRPTSTLVRVVTTEAVALTVVTESPRPIAILVNLTARRYNPIALIERLKSDPATRTIPLLAFAGHLETEKHQAARQAGADRTAANSSVSLHLPELLARLLRPTEKDDPDRVLEIEA